MTLPIDSEFGFKPTGPSPYLREQSLPLHYGRWGPPVAWAQVDNEFLSDLNLLRWTLRRVSPAQSPAPPPIPLTYLSRGKRWNLLKVITLLRTEGGPALLHHALDSSPNRSTPSEAMKGLLDHLNLLPFIAHRSDEPHDYRLPNISITPLEGAPPTRRGAKIDDALLPSFLKAPPPETTDESTP